MMLEDLQMLLDNFTPDLDLLHFRCCKKGMQLCVQIFGIIRTSWQKA